MSSSAEQIPTDDNNLSKVPPTEGNETVVGMEGDTVAPGSSDLSVHSISRSQDSRLWETETVDGFQFQERLVVKEGVCRRYLGIFLALLSTFIFSVNQIAQKTLVKNDFGPFNMASWVFPLQILATVPLLLYHTLIKKKQILGSIRPFRSHRKTIILIGVRSFSDSGSYILFFVTLDYLGVGDAIVIVSSAPVFVYILCRIFLKEPVGYVIIFTAILAIGGVVILSEPPGIYGGESKFNKKKLIGIVFALLATLTFSIALVIVRFMTHVFHGVLTTLSYFCGSIMAITLALVFKQLHAPPKSSFNLTNEYFLLISTAVMTVVAQSLLVLSLHYEQAGQVSLIRTLGVVFAFVWQSITTKAAPKPTSLIGGSMIVVGVVITISRKWLSSLPENNPYRRRFAMLLK